MGISSILQISSLITEQPGCFYVGDHLGDHLLDKLVLAERSSKLFSFARIAKRGFKACLGSAYRSPGDAVSSQIQRSCSNGDQPESLSAYHVFPGYPAVF